MLKGMINAHARTNPRTKNVTTASMIAHLLTSLMREVTSNILEGQSQVVHIGDYIDCPPLPAIAAIPPEDGLKLLSFNIAVSDGTISLFWASPMV